MLFILYLAILPLNNYFRVPVNLLIYHINYMSTEVMLSHPTSSFVSLATKKSNKLLRISIGYVFVVLSLLILVIKG